MTTSMWIICGLGVVFILAMGRIIYRDWKRDEDLWHKDLEEKYLKGPWK